jgi:integrase
LRCPQCGSSRTWKSGLRYLKDGTPVQRLLCRSCGYRFSEPKIKVDIGSQLFEAFKSRQNCHKVRIASRSRTTQKTSDDLPLFIGEDIRSHHTSNLSTVEKALNSLPFYNRNCQVCVSDKKAKNLEIKPQTQRLAGSTTTQADVRGKIVEYCFYMQKQGYAESTIRLNRTALKVLTARGANLLDPESVKEVVSRQKAWSQNRKRNVINAYNLFVKLNGLKWKRPKVKVTRKLPFIPTEQEIDALISGSGKKTATFLQLLKETAMRSGEAKRLQWIDLDFEKNLVTLNLPEKGSNPRMWKVSQKLMGMLNALPRKSQQIFGEGPVDSLKSTFLKTRKRLAAKLQNPRLLRISFHTLRHWKATTLYHKTKDPYYVKEFLGHKSLKSTEIYITIEHTMFEPGSDEFTVKVAEKPEDVKTLLEIGFEYICQKQGMIFLRKRK